MHRKLVSAFWPRFSLYSFIASEFRGVAAATKKYEHARGFIVRVANRSLLFSTAVDQLEEKSANNERK